MMIGRMFSDISSKLSNFNLIFEIPFKASIKNFSLRRFKTINDRRYRSYIIRNRKVLKLFIEEILYFEIGFSIINPFTDVEILEPFFPFV